MDVCETKWKINTDVKVYCCLENANGIIWVGGVDEFNVCPQNNVFLHYKTFCWKMVAIPTQ